MWLHDAFRDLQWEGVTRVGLRLVAAVVLGGVIGWEREIHHRWAGLRTHMLVTIGTATMMILATEMAPQMNSDPMRAIQGILAGIGFIGGGAILKLERERRIEGLTTAAGIWSTAAIGLAIGSGWLVLALMVTVVVLAVLWLLRILESRHGLRHDLSERHSDEPR